LELFALNSMGLRDNHDDECLEPFWAEDPVALLTDFSLVPRAKMSLEQKLNVITRIVIIVWILLLIIKYKHATLFLMTSLLVIVLIYYSKRRHETRIRRILKHIDKKSENHRFEARSENPMTSRCESTVLPNNDISCDDGFTRFEAKAGHGKFPPKNVDESKLVTTETMDSSEEAEQRRLKVAVKKQKHLNKLKKLQQEEDTLLQRQDHKNTKNTEKTIRKKSEEDGSKRNGGEKSRDGKAVQGGEMKRDPRRPWPPVVPFSMEVHASNKHVDQSNSIGEKRTKNLQRSYLGGPNRLADSKFHGYQVEAFQDDESGEEVDDEESSININQAQAQSGDYQNTSKQQRNIVQTHKQNHETPEEPKPAAIPKRTFLPANYDGAQDRTPPVKNENPKMTRHGAVRARRLPKWGDDNEVKTMHQASEMQFTRAAKLEQKTNPKGRTDYERKSQVHSLFG
jgi:hypothetical protein